MRPTTFSAEHAAADTMFGTGESFVYRECDACGSLTLVEAPDDLTAYYPPDYLSMTVDPTDLNPVARALVG